MTTYPLTQAQAYHQNLPLRIRCYLKRKRGISATIIEKCLIGWNGSRITIPIRDHDGEILFFRLARDPHASTSLAKMISTAGSRVELYGWERVVSTTTNLVICEGEFDRLALESHGFPAVSSTGGAGTFRSVWVQELAVIPHIFICFDLDRAGMRGAARIARLLPHARLITLPDSVGMGGDVTDYFVRLGHSAADFQELMNAAREIPESELPDVAVTSLPSGPVRLDHLSNSRIARIKRDIPIASLVSQYVQLRLGSHYFRGTCPFHEDREPSLVVYPDTNSFYCFGCTKYGDVVTFLREIEHLSFPDALNHLDHLRMEHDQH